MRAVAQSVLGLSIVLALSACQKSQTPAGGAPGADAAAPASSSAAAVPTDAEKKALLAALPAPYNNADVDNGQSRFAMCKSCHVVAKGGENGVGPNLYGVFGRKAASLAGYSYSDALKGLNVTWDAASIDKWISKPSAMAPGTKMTYVGMENPKDRIDVVAYLRTISGPAAP